MITEGRDIDLDTMAPPPALNKSMSGAGGYRWRGSEDTRGGRYGTARVQHGYSTVRTARAPGRERGGGARVGRPCAISARAIRVKFYTPTASPHPHPHPHPHLDHDHDYRRSDARAEAAATSAPMMAALLREERGGSFRVNSCNVHASGALLIGSGGTMATALNKLVSYSACVGCVWGMCGAWCGVWCGVVRGSLGVVLSTSSICRERAHTTTTTHHHRPPPPIRIITSGLPCHDDAHPNPHPHPHPHPDLRSPLP